MKMNIKHIFCLLAIAPAFTSCYEDKGNYDYTEVPVITATGLPASLSVVQKADYIELKPSFTSSTEGDINDNPNFEFGCNLWKNGGSFEDTKKRYRDIDSLHTKDIKYFANLDEGTYLAWYTVTDKRTGVTTNFKVPVKVTSSTYEGWLVLCDDKDGNARLDMVSVLSADRVSAVHDLLGDKAEKLKGASCLYYDPWYRYAKGDGIWYCTESGSYSMNATTLKPMYNVAESEFVTPLEGEQVVKMDGTFMGNNFAITDKGNLYRKNAVSYGAAFEDPINTFVVDTDPSFHVAPFIATCANRPQPWQELIAVFYDTDHKQFVSWYQYSANSGKCLMKMEDPEEKLFSYQTGMDMLDMQSTRFNGGVIYSVLRDNEGKRYVYGINYASGNYTQTYAQQMTAPGFDQATTFAYHSQYPYMFYNAGDKVYPYQLLNNTVMNPVTLPGEEVTLLKFNLFKHTQEQLTDHSDEFMAKQYLLIVGSYKKDATDGNGGILRFYKFDQSTGSLTLVDEYTGFGRIKDVAYRER